MRNEIKHGGSYHSFMMKYVYELLFLKESCHAVFIEPYLLSKEGFIQRIDLVGVKQENDNGFKLKLIGVECLTHPRNNLIQKRNSYMPYLDKIIFAIPKKNSLDSFKKKNFDLWEMPSEEYLRVRYTIIGEAICKNCGLRFYIQDMNDVPLDICPYCGKKGLCINKFNRLNITFDKLLIDESKQMTIIEKGEKKQFDLRMFGKWELETIKDYFGKLDKEKKKIVLNYLNENTTK